MNIFTSTAPAAEFDKTIAKIEEDTLTIKSKSGDGDVSSVFLSKEDAIELARAILKHHGLA